MGVPHYNVVVRRLNDVQLAVLAHVDTARSLAMRTTLYAAVANVNAASVLAHPCSLVLASQGSSNSWYFWWIALSCASAVHLFA